MTEFTRENAMKRAIIVPADLSGAPLAELRQWLGISNNNEEALLLGLLRASLDMCEAFTGQMPLENTCEELLAPDNAWHRLSAQPVRAITNVQLVDANDLRSAADPADYSTEIDADGHGFVSTRVSGEARALAVTYVAGIAANWYALPDPLKHGIIRLAAHNYRDRDASDPLSPPASVAALWRPWRAMRLA